ncbi:mitochondrial import inner membrane translocase subunit TIM50 [Aplysia californica]|uniref:Mitochondrial import inner membrane translocase subunit TIM50 n=1 Tax=Aplysia californica TaxID=6500 RepID=A0ABM1A7Q8_APLCA|nr:mitochondrial import inner membrane translocase subunit TIM50 [Aplysia californica]
MATFNVVMRFLTKGQQSAHRCLLQSTDVRNFSIISKVQAKQSYKCFQFQRCLSHFPRRLSLIAVMPASQVPLLQLHQQVHRRKVSPQFAPLKPTQNLLYSRLNSSTSKQVTPRNKAEQSGLEAGVNKDQTGDAADSGQPGEEKSETKESWWRGKNSWRLGLIFLGSACITWGVGLVTTWGAPLLDPDGNEIEDEFTEQPAALAYLKRTWKEMNIFKKKIQDPSREKLLPDPLKYPYIQPPYTLVIELTGVLIHPDWTYNTGWRFKKRPGIDYFLSQVGPPLFEVVIYSSESGMTADPLVSHLDPQGFIMYRLYRDATRYTEGHHLKDLSCLNRDMSRIIMLDCNKESVKLQPRNAFVLSKWKGEDEDRTLIDLAHFLKTVAASGVDDIRPVLDYYHQFDDPIAAFKDNQRKLQEEEEARAKLASEETKKKSWFSGFRNK